ncbi:MAG: polyprenol monophosphomannose synthase [Actinomycetota bacterium]
MNADGRRAVVVIPTYNEVGNIESLIRSIMDVMPDAGILVVDDASPDGTADVVRGLAREFGDRVEVLSRPAKSGLGTAYRAGFSEVLSRHETIVVQMDADLSHDPTYLPALVASVELGADAALGSRYVPGGRIENWPRLRRFLSRWGNRYAAGMLGLAVNDATSGYRAYSPTLLRRIDFATVRAEGYGFQIEMTHRAVRADARIVEVPIRFVDRVIGESKLSYHIINEAFFLVNRLWFTDLSLGSRRRR